MQRAFGVLWRPATVLLHLKCARKLAAAVPHGHLASRVRVSHFEAGNAML
jgi:hypothetical protein